MHRSEVRLGGSKKKQLGIGIIQIPFAFAKESEHICSVLMNLRQLHIGFSLYSFPASEHGAHHHIHHSL